MSVQILVGDCRDVLETLPDASVQTVVTSPPYYGLRDYGEDDQIGLEETPEAYIAEMVAVFREVRRVLRDDGTVFLNLGDSYFSGSQRAVSCGISDKEPEGYRDRDCLCGNLCDVCREVYRRKSHTYDLLVPMLTASLSAPTLARMGFERDHLPTWDFAHLVNHIFPAIADLVHSSIRDDEQPHALISSMPDEFSRQLLGVCLQRANHGECLLCARSLTDYVQGCAHTLPRDSGGQLGRSQDNALRGDQLAHRSQCTDRAYGCCIDDVAYPHYTTEYRNSLKPKDLIGIPWRVALALQADGWWLRSDIIWHKPNPMPESVTDRPTKAHEYVFLLTKSARYFYDADAVAEESLSFGRQHTSGIQSPKTRALKEAGFHGEGGDLGLNYERQSRNRRSVWSIATKPYSGAHFAVMPPDLVEPCIKAGTSERGACPECGAPWERVTERCETINRTTQNGHGNGEFGSYGRFGDALSTTVGWQPTCDCGQTDPVPCVVLDPFGGAGTVGLVADRLGRDAILIELNVDYAEMARRRIVNDAPMFARVEVK